MSETTGNDALTEDVVRKVAKLSRLALDEQHLHTYRDQLSSILDYMERLRGLDLADVEPLAHPTDACNRIDEDALGASLPTEALMKMSPESAPPFIKVPKVLGDGGGA